MQSRHSGRGKKKETGMRSSEFAALQNSDINLDKMIITVQKTRGVRYKDPVNRLGVEEYIKVTKDAKPRIIPISPVCLEAVQEMQPFRKSLATTLYESSGHDLLLVQLFLQHSPPNVSRRYVNIGQDAIKAAMLATSRPFSV